MVDEKGSNRSDYSDDKDFYDEHHEYSPTQSKHLESALMNSASKRSLLSMNSKNSRVKHIFSTARKEKKSHTIEPTMRHYYTNTKQLINQAVKVLDGERAYNEANLDQFLMGIRNIKVKEKQKGPKHLPSL